jgi:hypothetical protein
MEGEKDRFGELMRLLERAREDVYFAAKEQSIRPHPWSPRPRSVARDVWFNRAYLLASYNPAAALFGQAIQLGIL